VSNFVGAAIAFLLGAGIATGNYYISRHVLKTNPDKYSLTMVARQFVQVTFIVLVYMLGAYTPWDRLWLLVGGVLGMTLPMIWYTGRLVKLNDSGKRKEGKPNG